MGEITTEPTRAIVKPTDEDSAMSFYSPARLGEALKSSNWTVDEFINRIVEITRDETSPWTSLAASRFLMNHIKDVLSLSGRIERVEKLASLESEGGRKLSMRSHSERLLLGELEGVSEIIQDQLPEEAIHGNAEGKEGNLSDGSDVAEALGEEFQPGTDFKAGHRPPAGKIGSGIVEEAEDVGEGLPEDIDA